MTVVETSHGKIEGERSGAHLSFLGIPYAKPPVGPLRFRAPEPPEHWKGVRATTRFGASAMQGAAFVPGAIPDGPQSEDCLYLNVFTPGVGREQPRAVLVFVHGGAFTVGSAASPLYDGGPLAEIGDVVVVTLNYRVGALGFLALGKRGRQIGAAPNRGLLDQLAALEWVRENIAAFGGDPRSVTVFGESAGATSVCLWLTAAGTGELFQRAICQSPVAFLQMATEESAAATTHAFLGALGLAEGRLHELQTVPVDVLMQAQLSVEADLESWPHFTPVLDDTHWPEHPAETLRRGGGSRVPLLIGHNRDEWNLFALRTLADWAKPLDTPGALACLAPKLPPSAGASRASALLEAYRESRRALDLPHDNRALLRAIEGDLRFGIPTLRFADLYASRGVSTFAYRFTYASPALRGALGSCHALELPFVFGTLHAPDQDRFAGTGPAVQALSLCMQRAWLAFAKSGSPGHPDSPAWPRHEETTRPTLIFDLEPHLEHAPFEAERRAWDGIFCEDASRAFP
jgi:para-nitrobenzyl esterase